MYHPTNRWVYVLGLLTVTLIVLTSLFGTTKSGQASVGTATATIIAPPKLPLVFGKTITRSAYYDHFDVHCFDADPNKDVIITIDSSVLLDIGTSYSIVWQTKDGERNEGGGGSGGGGGSALPDEATSEVVFLPGDFSVERLPKGSVVVSISTCVWISRTYRGTATYRMKAIEVSPQPLTAGITVTSTIANSTYRVSSVNNGLYMVQATDKTGISLTTIQSVGSAAPSFWQSELSVGKPKFTVRLQSTHLMVRGNPPYQVSIERLQIEDVGITPITISLTNQHPVVILQIVPLITPQLEVEASVVSGSGAIVGITYQPRANDRMFVLKALDLTQSAKGSMTIPNEGSGPTYILVALPNITRPDPSRSVTLKIVAKASP